MIFDKNILANFQLWVKEFGLRGAVKKLLEEFGVRNIIVNGSLPATGPVLIVSNHTGVFDSLLLLSRIIRQDFYWTALATYEVFGAEVKKKLISIYRRRQLNHKIYEYPLCLQVNGKLPKNYSHAEIMAKNRQSIHRAAELVNQGKAVSIFPTGGAGKPLSGSRWKAGAGFLIKQISNPKTKLVLAKITGTKQSDLIVLVPFLRRLFFKPQPITLAFSPAKWLNKAIDLTQDAKAITRQLEKLYNQTYL